MTDPVTVPEASRKRTGGWIKALLVVSLGLNLLIAGLAAGAFLRDGGWLDAARPVNEFD